MNRVREKGGKIVSRLCWRNNVEEQKLLPRRKDQGDSSFAGIPGFRQPFVTRGTRKSKRVTRDPPFLPRVFRYVTISRITYSHGVEAGDDCFALLCTPPGQS